MRPYIGKRIFRLFSGSLQSLKFDLCYRVISLT